MSSRVPRIYRRKKRLGLTLTEVVIGIAISSLIIMAVASLQFVSARSINDLYAQTRLRSLRVNALDQMRYRLMNARIGTAQVTENGHRVSFTDPYLAGAVSSFTFSPETHVLTYDDNVAAAPDPRPIGKGLESVTFELEGVAGRETIIKIRLKTLGGLARGRSDAQDGETAINLRNI